MAEKRRNLVESLHSPRQGAQAGTTSAPVCALVKSSCRKCMGSGVQLVTGGVQTAAALCECVSKCAACFGSCRLSINGHSKPCRKPTPARVCTLINEARIPIKYARASLDAFTNYTGNGREVIQYVHKWLMNFQVHSGKGILFTGSVGVGKTFILAAIAKGLALRGFSVRFVDFFQLLGELKAAYANDKSDDSVLAPLVNCDVLIIDELGKGRSTDWEMTVLDSLIMGRYNQGKIIVASTNYLTKIPSGKSQNQFNIDLEFSSKQEQQRSGFSPDEFGPLEPRVGKRIYSRLFEMATFLEIQGQDYRRRMREDQNAHETPP